VLATFPTPAGPIADSDAIASRPHMPGRSLADRDEYGPITGRPGGLFTAPAAALALELRDELGRRIAAWVPDGDLL
jgi:hypothetical protein